MVGYDDNANALTLGDDDSLKVGDYELKYSSADDDFRIVHPNGEESNVPRSTSGSLVPQGLADVVGNGEVLADDGNIYTSVQTAVDNASGWVFVGPGTFSETVSVTTAGLTIEGSGYDTLIDATTTTAVSSSGTTDVTFRNFSISSQNVDGNFARALDLGSGGTANEIIVRDSENEGIDPGSDCTVINCRVENTGSDAIRVTGTGNIISNCIVVNAGADSIDIKDDDNIVSGNIVNDGGGSGILLDSNADDCVVGGNRIISTSSTGVIMRGNNNILYNNRISDSGGISDTGTGNVEDGNLTGASN